MLLRKPIYLSISVAMLLTILLYKVPFTELGPIFLKGTFGINTINLILAFYLITFLQRMMEKRDRLTMAEVAISKLFENRRVNSMFVPFIIGFLPSPGAVLIAKPIVDKAAGDYLDDEERCFVSSYYRHISEAFLPTYSSIILAIQLAGVTVSGFVGAMLPLIFILFVLGYFFYIRKIPVQTGDVSKGNKKREIINFLRGVWPIFLAVILIMTLGVPVFWAVGVVIVLYFFVEKFSFKEILPFLKSAVESRLLLIVLVIMNFKEVLNYTGMIQNLPGYFSNLPIPYEVLMGMMIFFGTLVAGSQAMITIVIPLAFSAMPDGGVILLALLMSLSYISMQISPTHVCLGIITEAYGVQFSSLVGKTLPLVFLFIIFSYSYFYLFKLIF